RLHHVERQTLGQPFHDVGHDDLVGQPRLGDALNRGRSVLACSDDGYFHQARPIFSITASATCDVPTAVGSSRRSFKSDGTLLPSLITSASAFSKRSAAAVSFK